MSDKRQVRVDVESPFEIVAFDEDGFVLKTRGGQTKFYYKTGTFDPPTDPPIVAWRMT